LNAAVALPAPFDWANPDYTSVFAERIERLRRIRANPASP